MRYIPFSSYFKEQCAESQQDEPSIESIETNLHVRLCFLLRIIVMILTIMSHYYCTTKVFPLSNYLENEQDEYFSSFRVPDSIVLKKGLLFGTY